MENADGGEVDLTKFVNGVIGNGDFIFDILVLIFIGFSSDLSKEFTCGEVRILGFSRDFHGFEFTIDSCIPSCRHLRYLKKIRY